MYVPSETQIRKFVAEHFPNFKEANSSKVGPILKINSPFDDDPDSNKRKFNIIIRSGKCKDFRGDSKWTTGNTSFIYFVQLFKRCSYKEAIELLGKYGKFDQKRGFSLRKPEEIKDDEANPSLIQLPASAQAINPSSANSAHAIAIRWLKRRGFGLEFIDKYNIMVNGLNVLFPYYEGGELVYWQQRSTANKFFEYPDTEKCKVGKADFLYNFDNVDPNLPVALFESISNTLTIERQALATGSADISPKQIKKLKMVNKCRCVILAFDNDKPGISAMVKFYKTLNSEGFRVQYVLPPKMPSKKGGFITDWNELHTDLEEPWSFGRIRDYFRKSILELNMIEAVKLQMQMR